MFYLHVALADRGRSWDSSLIATTFTTGMLYVSRLVLPGLLWHRFSFKNNPEPQPFGEGGAENIMQTDY